MKKIKLTKGFEAIVDDADYEWLNNHKWHVMKGSKYTHYARTKIKGEIKRMHRLILELTNPKEEVDHINGNGLDNQRHNLRKATHAQNQKNKKSSGKTSQYLGVCKVIQKTPYGVYEYWNAAISLNGKNKTIGRFKDEKEAALAYNKLASEFHGEFARLNML